MLDPSPTTKPAAPLLRHELAHHPR
jgi:hypothetical protein